MTWLYARTSDLNRITQLTFSDEDQEIANALIYGLDTKKVDEVSLQLLDTVLSATKRCKGALNPQEWTASRAELANLLEVAFSFEHQFKCVARLGLQRRLYYASLQEIACDLLSMRLCDCDDLEKNFNLRLGWGMASVVLGALSEEDWFAVRRVLGSRVLLPDCLFPTVERVFAEFPSNSFRHLESRLPDEWRHHSKAVGHLIATLRGIQPQLLRWNPMPPPAKQSGDEKIPVTTGVSQGTQFDGCDDSDNTESQSHPEDTLRRHTEELYGAMEHFLGAQERSAAVRSEAVEFGNANYPLYSQLLLEKAMILDEEGSPDLALEKVLEALCLTPRNRQAWQSFGLICERLGHSVDSAVSTLLDRSLEIYRL